jgi:hypothetical protein
LNSLDQVQTLCSSLLQSNEMESAAKYLAKAYEGKA